jgi:hypothetical protein
MTILRLNPNKKPKEPFSRNFLFVIKAFSIFMGTAATLQKFSEFILVNHMKSFINRHQEIITGVLTMFDRVICQGSILQFQRPPQFSYFLHTQGILLKEFKSYATSITKKIIQNARDMAEKNKRPYIYLEKTLKSKNNEGKEDFARQIAQKDGIREGLICILSCLELCSTMTVVSNYQTFHLETARRSTKCLHLYFYFMDKQFGLIHVRIQTWFPFNIQIYFNGREWLARQLDKNEIQYERFNNSFSMLSDPVKAQKLCAKLTAKKCLRLFKRMAKSVNPILSAIRKANFGEYYWTARQIEVATDIMFTSRSELEKLLPDFHEYSVLYFSAEDVMRFLHKKNIHGNFKADIITDRKKRPEGRRVKHWIKGNSIKWYDKGNCLRVETTINRPQEFKILRDVQTRQGVKKLWRPSNKGICNIRRLFQAAFGANKRYLDALSQVNPSEKIISELDTICHPLVKNGNSVAGFSVLSKNDYNLFGAAMSGEFAVNGFRNRDLRGKLYPNIKCLTKKETMRFTARVSRLIFKMRSHSLVEKVPRSALYRITPKGLRVFSSVIEFRQRFYTINALKCA